MTDFIVTPETLDIQLQAVALEAAILNTGDDAPILKAINPDDFDDCEFLIQIHPELYREERLSAEMKPTDAERYRLFLRSIDATLCEFRVLLRDLFLLYQPFEAPYPVLPFLAPIVGVDFNFDVPEEFARREVANAIFLWKRKGTRDNIADWIGFISGFRVKIREYYKEVLRTNVYNQVYAQSPSTILNQGGKNYATLPHLSETHLTNTWSGDAANLPFFDFNHEDNTNYGVHGFTQLLGEQRGFFHVARYTEGWDDFLPFPGTEKRIESIGPGDLAPGFLFRNHVGLFIDIVDDQVDRLWFGEPVLDLFIDKIERILDIICFYGVVKHLIFRLVTNEDGGLCEQITFNVRASFAEGWNDIEPLPIPFLQTETISCDGVIEDCIACLGETWGLDIDNVACDSDDDAGRLANFVLCTNDIARVTNDAVLDTNGGPWLTWHYARYWENWAGRFPIAIPTLGTPGAQAIGDIFQTYIGAALTTEIVIPAEITSGEEFIDPIIGTGTGQGRETLEPISQFIIDACETGRFEDNILNFVEEWNNPFVDTAELTDDWNIPELFADAVEFFDDWNLPNFLDTPEIIEDWNIPETFFDTLVASDTWEITQVFADEEIHCDDWEVTVPLTIPGPGMWLDGNNGPKANSPVGLWIDRFTTDNDAEQSVPANQPDLDKNDVDFNDFGSVTFDGVDDYMVVTDDATLNGDQFTAFVVFQWAYPGVGDTLISKSTDGTFSDGWGLVSQGSNTLRFYVDDINTNFADAVIPNDETQILCVRYDQTRLELVVNGQVLGGDLYGGGVTNSAKDLIVGAHNTASSIAGFFGGTIAEVIYYNRDLDNDEKVTLLNYLGTKYNVVIDLTTEIVTESWDFAPAYVETPEVTEPFDFPVSYVAIPEVTEPFEFIQAYNDVIEVEEGWDSVSLPDIPVLEVFDDFSGDVVTVVESWDLTLAYTETPELVEGFNDVITYAETPEIVDGFEFGRIYSDSILVDEPWEAFVDLTDPGVLEYEEDWEAINLTDPGTPEYEETWEPTVFSPVLEFGPETWNPTVFVVDSSSFQFSENWNAQYVAVLVDFENWNSEFIPNLEHAETWEAIYVVDSSSFQFTEFWIPGTYVVDSSSFQHFEDWET